MFFYGANMATVTSEVTQEGQSTQRVWLDFLKEVGIIAVVYVVYSLSRGSLEEKASVAFENARGIIECEKALRIFVELDVQAFFLSKSFLLFLVNIMYTYGYFTGLIGFALWAYWRHRRKYKIMRTVFILSAALAFFVFAIYPVAPPRFFDGVHGGENLGFVDTPAMSGVADFSGVQAFYNPYAAMPSLHIGWTLMVSVGIIWMTKSRWVKLLGASLPLAQFITIVATGNHFILDAVGGVIVLGICLGLTALLMQLNSKFREQGNRLAEGV